MERHIVWETEGKMMKCAFCSTYFTLWFKNQKKLLYYARILKRKTLKCTRTYSIQCELCKVRGWFVHGLAAKNAPNKGLQRDVVYILADQ